MVQMFAVGKIFKHRRTSYEKSLPNSQHVRTHVLTQSNLQEIYLCSAHKFVVNLTGLTRLHWLTLAEVIFIGQIR